MYMQWGESMFFDINTPITVTDFGRIEQSGGYWHADWQRSLYMLFYLSGGDLTMDVAGKETKLNEGDSLIVPPCTRYRPLESSGCQYYYFYFSAQESEEYRSKFSIRNSYCRSIPNFAYRFNYSERTVISVDTVTRHTENSRIGKIINRCAELDLWQRPDEKMLLDIYLKEYLIQLSLMQQASANVDQAFTRMTTFIHTRYKDDIGLSDVAQKVHLSPSYAAKLFKRNAGIRCCDYINNVRLATACGMLINTSMRISDIAEDVGYKSQYYFARQFKKVYGITATQYRKKGVEQ